MDASIFDSALSHTRRWDASEREEKKIACPLLDVFACGQVSSPRLLRLKSFLKSKKFRISDEEVKKFRTYRTLQIGRWERGSADG